MLDSYFAEKEVFFSMKKLFNQLYENEPEFKKAYDKNKKVELKMKSEGVAIFSIVGSKVDIDLAGYEWFIGDETPVSFSFSEAFQYEEKGAYSYTGGVVVEEDNAEDGSNYYLVPSIQEYPAMDRVLVKEGKEKEWKHIKGVPSVFKELLNILGVYEEDDELTTIVGIYNVEDNLVIDSLSSRYGIVSQDVYGTGNSKLDSCIEKILEALKSIKVPVEEVFIFRLGSMSSCRLKLKSSGEYTLVIE